jgi:tetratricopeptide (TPR) repeat protein
VVNLTYYRETDMERYSTEDYFLFENGVFYDRESFRGRTNYNALMNSLLWKMRCEAQAGSNRYRVVDPPVAGASHVNFNVLNVPEADSPEWGPIISNWMAKVTADPRNADVYVGRGNMFHLMRRLEEAASDYERAMQLGSKDVGLYNNLAVIRSMSTNAVLRNGGQAVKLAEQACELTGWKSWMCISALAAAYAETGDFTRAVKYERQVIAMPGLMPLEREAEERALARMLKHLPVRDEL